MINTKERDELAKKYAGTYDRTNAQDCFRHDCEIEAFKCGFDAALARAEKLVKALEFYADDSRWHQREVFATGCELASRYDDTRGESVSVEIKPGQSMGFKHVPAASTQADRGKRARAALKKWGGEE